MEKLDLWHCPSLGELPFRGLLIEEGWLSGASNALMALPVLGCISIVLGSKLIFHDWDTAWTVGGVFVALTVLLCGGTWYSVQQQ